KSVLQKDGLGTGLGDEGGFAPNLPNNRAALDLIITAIEKAGFKPGEEIGLALDVAATEFFADGNYKFEGGTKSAAEMAEYYGQLVADYPLISIEDPLDEDDWEGWSTLVGEIGKKVQIVGDDLFVTNPERLDKGIELGSANSLPVKLDKVGIIFETLDAISPVHDHAHTTFI